MTYMYVKSSALRYDKQSNRKVVDVNDAKLHNRIAKQINKRVQNLAFTFKQKGGTKPFNRGQYKGTEKRTCAIYNLVIQANLVLEGWNECG